MSKLKCFEEGHTRIESTFRTDRGERITVAHCKVCKVKLSVITHE